MTVSGGVTSGVMRIGVERAVVSEALVVDDRAVPITRRVTVCWVTARTWTARVRVAPAARLPREKHRERPARCAPPVCVTTRFAGSVRQVVTDATVALLLLEARMAMRIVSPLRRRVRPGSTTTSILVLVAVVLVEVVVVAEVVLVGVIAFDGADAGEVPVVLVAETVKV